MTRPIGRAWRRFTTSVVEDPFPAGGSEPGMVIDSGRVTFGGMLAGRHRGGQDDGDTTEEAGLALDDRSGQIMLPS